MAALEWDPMDERWWYEAGVSHGVFYPLSGAGVVWNGILSIDDDTNGGETSKHYIDGISYLTRVESREYQAKLTALSAPKEFAAYSGHKGPIAGFSLTRQPKRRFNFSYQTGIGEDECRIHLIYNVMATPDSTSRQTIGQSIAPTSLVWDLTATPVEVPGMKPTAHLVIDSTKLSVSKFIELQNLLYGTDSTGAFFPDIEDLLTLFGVTP